METDDSLVEASGSVVLLSHVEDQTDEDFFDKLINDEFGTKDTNTSNSGDVVGLPVDSEDVHNNHLDPLIKSQKVDQINSLIPKMDILEEKSMVMVTLKPFTFENIVLNGDIQSAKIDVEIRGDMDNLSETVNISKADSTNIKEVQWSAFTSRPEEDQLLGDFGSFSDFLTDNSTDFSKIETTNIKSSATIGRNTITESSTSTWVGSLEHQYEQYGSENGVNGIGEQDDQRWLNSNSQHEQDGQTNLDANDPLYWEKHYPGWKYDFNTGQWYQVVTDAGDSSSNDPIHGSVANSEASFHGQTESAPAYENTQAYSYNSSSNSTINYPVNMVFDSQYPGWYYDTNTQQWQTLESYTQMTVTETSMVVQNKLTFGHSATSDNYFLEKKYSLNCNDVNQFDNHNTHDQIHKELLGEDLSVSLNNNYSQLSWQPQAVDDGHGIGSILHDNNSEATVATMQGFIPSQNMYQYNLPSMVEQSQHYEDTFHSYYGDSNSTVHSQHPFQSGNLSHSQMSYHSAGRPLHALVTLGFGGKLVVMKNTTLGTSLSTVKNQDGCGGIISILNMMDLVMDKTDSSGVVLNGVDYFNSLCNQSFPGPLVGGNAASKDLNKWIDARIAACELSSFDLRKPQILRLLLSLLKISHQCYGKLRPPFATEPSQLENDGPESAVTNLFASSRKDNTNMREHGAFTNCMHNFPSEGQIQGIASEVQTLLVSGKRREALQRAQEGMLWGPALVLAAQIGEKFYIDTVKKMAHCQFISGSPLRTLCLLIAGQPADVFTNGSMSSSFSNKVNLPQQSDQ
ncbi:COPII coat assembly protein sec16, partial [Zostera marina]